MNAGSPRKSNFIECKLEDRPDLNAPDRSSARAWGLVYINDDGTLNEDPTPDMPPPSKSSPRLR